jgi:cobalt-zinc-cadmium efflux system protein
MHLRFLFAVLLNIVLAVTQAFYANQAHSVSLLSDALHNLGDVVGLVIAWAAQTLARYRAPARYTYGYKKLTIVAACTNALLLMSSVVVITYEAISKLLHPHPMDEMRVLLIASLGVLINSGTALLFIKEKKNDISINVTFLHLILDALTSLGVVVNALLVYYSGYQWIDPMIAFMIATVILVGSSKLLSRSMSLLLGAVPPHINQHAVRQYLMQIPGVEVVSHLHIWAISTKETALSAHLRMPKSLLSEVDYHTIQEELRERFAIQNMTLQAEKRSQDS